MAKEREPLPWTKLNYDHLLDDPAVVCMTNEQLGGYLKLLRAAWKSSTPGHLPNEPAYLSAISGLAPWAFHQQAIERAFDCSDPAWLIQRRIVREYESAGRMHEVKRANAMQRWSGSNAGAMQVHSIRSERERGEVERDLEKESKNTLARSARVSRSESPAFKEFYDEVWPRRVGRDAAWRKWQQVARSPEDSAAILEGAEAWAEHYASERTEQQFIPHPSTWLNQGRWKDAPPKRKDGSDDLL